MLSFITLLFSSTMLTSSSIEIVGAPTFSFFARGKKNSGPPRKDGPYKRRRNPRAQSGVTAPQRPQRRETQEPTFPVFAKGGRLFALSVI
jgi:hypothetical protein